MERGYSLLGGVSPKLSKAAGSYDRVEKRLPVAAILPDPNQPRRHFDEEAIKELAESIRSTGFLIHDPVVREVRGEEGEPEKYYLVSGERRWRAIRMLGWRHVDVTVIAIDDPYKIRLIQTAENRQRYELDLEDEAENARVTLELGVKNGKMQMEVAADLGYPAATFCRLLAVNSAPEPVKAVIRDGRTKNLELIGYLTSVLEFDAALFRRISEPEMITVHLARELNWAVKNGHAANDLIARLDALPGGARRLGVRPEAAKAPAAQEAVPASQPAPTSAGNPSAGSEPVTDAASPAPQQPVGEGGGPESDEAALMRAAGAAAGDNDDSPVESQDGAAGEGGGGSRRSSTLPDEMLAPERGNDVVYTQLGDEDETPSPAAAGGVKTVSTRLGPVSELDVMIGDQTVSLLLNDPRTDGARAACLYADGRIEVVDLAAAKPTLLSISRRA